jgi:hypothetical protein
MVEVHNLWIPVSGTGGAREVPELREQVRLYRRDLLHPGVWWARVRQSRSPSWYRAMNVQKIYEYALQRLFKDLHDRVFAEYPGMPWDG